MVFIRNRRYRLRRSLCDGVRRVGASILALPAPSLGKSFPPYIISKYVLILANTAGLEARVSCRRQMLSRSTSKVTAFAHTLPKKWHSIFLVSCTLSCSVSHKVEPIWADLNGGMDRLPDLADITVRSRQEINAESSLRKAISRDNALDYKITNGPDAEAVLRNVPVTPRANFKFEFPKPELPQSLADLSHLQGLIDLEKVIVIAGFAEVGPWGSSRTRWEMEARGEFTIEGCIEMAWIMGFIKHFDGKLPNGSLYVGWVDAKSGDPVDDKDVKAKYEAEHSGPFGHPLDW